MMRLGATEAADKSFTLRIVEKGQIYDVTQLTLKDLMETRDFLDFVIQGHMRNAQEKLQPQRTDGASAIRGPNGACPWATEGVPGSPISG